MRLALLLALLPTPALADADRIPVCFSIPFHAEHADVVAFEAWCGDQMLGPVALLGAGWVAKAQEAGCDVRVRAITADGRTGPFSLAATRGSPKALADVWIGEAPLCEWADRDRNGVVGLADFSSWHRAFLECAQR